jgi:hypothetical protein
MWYLCLDEIRHADITYRYALVLVFCPIQRGWNQKTMQRHSEPSVAEFADLRSSTSRDFVAIPSFVKPDLESIPPLDGSDVASLHSFYGFLQKEPTSKLRNLAIPKPAQTTFA